MNTLAIIPTKGKHLLWGSVVLALLLSGCAEISVPSNPSLATLEALATVVACINPMPAPEQPFSLYLPLAEGNQWTYHRGGQNEPLFLLSASLNLAR